MSRVSVVVPAYKEVLSLPHLIARLEPLRAQFDEMELIIMDDQSKDGSEELVQQLALPWVKMIVRKKERGLSQSVVEGFSHASGDVIVVMDADLSHPPEVIPQMVAKALSHEFVVGSRYVEGGGLDEAWTAYRWVNSKVATLMARPFTRVKDPMSGFFAFRKDLLKRTQDLNPIGYKIGLELIVKGDFKDVVEVPIFFSDRKFGESKLSLKEHIRYLKHIKRLADHRFGSLSYALQFFFVGGTGVLVNEIVLTILHALGTSARLSILGGVLVSMTSNFILNRFITFTYAKDQNLVLQFFKYVLANSLGTAINLTVAYQMMHFFPSLSHTPQIPALVGVIAGVGFNFSISKIWVFRKIEAKDFKAAA